MAQSSRCFLFCFVFINLLTERTPRSVSDRHGMPYATMRYEEMKTTNEHGKIMLPTVMSEIGLAETPSLTADAARVTPTNPILSSEREVEMHFHSSDFTWSSSSLSQSLFSAVVDEDTGAVQLVVDSDRTLEPT
jgi:hypothetical protein